MQAKFDLLLVAICIILNGSLVIKIAFKKKRFTSFINFLCETINW